jgi:putative membrane protein insertion efficiency factor
MKKMKSKKPLLILISSIITLLMITPCLAENSHLQNQDNPEKNLFLFPIHFYRKYISGADGDRCPMHPSCSTYSLEAFKKHGLIKGWVMTSDRLMRCGRDELKLGQPVMAREKTRVYDPVQNNDFWWNKSEKP